MVEDDKPTDDSAEGWGELVVAAIQALGGPVLDAAKVPVTFARNFGKAAVHLGAIPKALIAARVASINADSDARIAFTKATAKAMAKAVDVPEEFVALATAQEARRILRKQHNSLAVVEIAAEELRKEPYLGDAPQAEISDDWLNAFEREAMDMSSEEMRIRFGKILAGEVRRPGSYSIRTVKLLAQLDNDAAAVFRRFCSLAVSIQSDSRILDSRVVTFEQVAGQNGLGVFGLGFAELLLLSEYGLLVPSMDTTTTYAALQGGTQYIPFKYHGVYYAMVPTQKGVANLECSVALNGAQLSRAGLELLGVVELEPENKAYTARLFEAIHQRGFNVVPILHPAGVPPAQSGAPT